MSKIPKLARTNSQSSEDSVGRRTSSRIAAKSQSQIPVPIVEKKEEESHEKPTRSQRATRSASVTQSETSDVVEVPEVKTPGRKGRPSKKNSIQESDDSTATDRTAKESTPTRSRRNLRSSSREVSASPSRVTRSMRTRGVVSPIVEVVQLDSDDNDDMPISSTKRQTRASSRARSAAREVEAAAPSKFSPVKKDIKSPVKTTEDTVTDPSTIEPISVDSSSPTSSPSKQFPLTSRSAKKSDSSNKEDSTPVKTISVKSTPKNTPVAEPVESAKKTPTKGSPIKVISEEKSDVISDSATPTPVYVDSGSPTSSPSKQFPTRPITPSSTKSSAKKSSTSKKDQSFAEQNTPVKSSPVKEVVPIELTDDVELQKSPVKSTPEKQVSPRKRTRSSSLKSLQEDDNDISIVEEITTTDSSTPKTNSPEKAKSPVKSASPSKKTPVTENSKEAITPIASTPGLATPARKRNSIICKNLISSLYTPVTKTSTPEVVDVLAGDSSSFMDWEPDTAVESTPTKSSGGTPVEEPKVDPEQPVVKEDKSEEVEETTKPESLVEPEAEELHSFLSLGDDEVFEAADLTIVASPSVDSTAPKESEMIDVSPDDEDQSKTCDVSMHVDSVTTIAPAHSPKKESPKKESKPPTPASSPAKLATQKEKSTSPQKAVQVINVDDDALVVDDLVLSDDEPQVEEQDIVEEVQVEKVECDDGSEKTKKSKKRKSRKTIELGEIEESLQSPADVEEVTIEDDVIETPVDTLDKEEEASVEVAEQEEVVTKKTKKSKKKKTEKSAEPPVEDVVEAVEEPVVKKSKKKKAKQAASIKDNNEEDDEREEAISSDQPSKLTFKKLFNNPSKTRKALKSSLSSLYTWSCDLQRRNDDLCNTFLNDHDETIWQQILHRNGQVNKDFKKIKTSFEDTVELNDDELPDNDDEDDVSDEEDDMLEMGEDQEGFDDEEEEECDLFNLKDSDLAELEREFEKGEQGEDDGEGDEEEQEQQPKKKYRKSAVDDKFFSLAEMNEFCDNAEKENEEDNILTTVDDSWGGSADYKYQDFFGSLDDVVDSKKDRKSHKRKLTEEEYVPKKEAKKSKKSVHWQDEDEEEAMDEQEGDEEAIDDEEQEEEGPVLLGDGVQEDEEQPETNLKSSLKKLKQTIKKLEEENLQPRSWELSGEISAQQRDENALLETHVEFDHGSKKAPEINEDFTEKLEDLIKQRIKDNVYDDVVRKKKVDETVQSYRNEAIEEMEMVKTSLAEVYEKEYQKAAGETDGKTKVDEKAVEIEKKMADLFALIDGLSHYEFSPPEVRPEVRVVSNMDALRVEEVGMMASTDAQLLAPEELKKRQKGDLKADEERTTTDKLRQRRKKKNKQRAMVIVMNNDSTNDADSGAKKLKKKKSKKAAEETGKENNANLKSSNFFNQLQDTVRKELKEKTTKKKKLGAGKVTAGSSKFKL